MTVRRFNNTGRKRIQRRHAQIALDAPAEDGVRTFEASLNLSSYGLDGQAAVVVEAYRQHTRTRFDYGSVDEIAAPDDRRLTEFSTDDPVRFRVKAISQSDGLLLAVADRIAPFVLGEDTETRVPLLPVRGASIGSVAWRLDYDPAPVLTVNSGFGPWKERARSRHFKWYVYPEVVRQVLKGILIEDKNFPSGGSDEWWERWLVFAHSLRGVGPLPTVDDETEVIEMWIEGAAQAFCRTHRLTAGMTYTGD